jgi:hypothetical protein
MFAVVVVVVVATAAAQRPETRAVVGGLEQSLEPGSTLVVRESSRPLDEPLDELAASDAADGVAVVDWSDTELLRARLRTYATSTHAITERDIDFRSTDASAERGRTVGFALASMLPPAPPVAPPFVAPVVPPAAAPASEEPPPGPSPSARTRWGIDVRFAATTAASVRANGIGGEVGASVRLTSSTNALDARVAIAATRGELTSLASLWIVRPRAGVGVVAISAAPITLTLRAEVGPWLHVVDRGAGASPNRGSRWVPGATLGADLAWSMARALDLVVGAGADVAFGTTRVVSGVDQSVTIPVLRFVGSSGFSFRF